MPNIEDKKMAITKDRKINKILTVCCKLPSPESICDYA